MRFETKEFSEGFSDTEQVEVHVRLEPLNRSDKDRPAGKEGGALDQARSDADPEELLSVEGEEADSGKIGRLAGEITKVLLEDSEGTVPVVRPENHDRDKRSGFPGTETTIPKGDEEADNNRGNNDAVYYCCGIRKDRVIHY